MKYLYFLILCLLLLTCKSTENFTGTVASRYSIDPFPSKEEWVSISNSIEKLTVNELEMKFRSALLWQVGVYTEKGISLNFPGEDDETDNIYFSGADFNKEFLDYFSKKNIPVYLKIEPGSSSVFKSIDSTLKRYSSFDCVMGICIDLEWIDKSEISTSSIDKWSVLVNSHNEDYKLLLKHWNINKVPEHYSDNLVYINTIENLTDSSNVIKRATLWYKKFYPAEIGFLIGHKKDNSLWSNYKLIDVINDFYEAKIDYKYLLWSETNLDILQQ